MGVVETEFGDFEVMGESDGYQTRLIHVSYGWKLNFLNHAGGLKTIVLCSGAGVLTCPDKHRQFIGNGFCVSVDTASTFSVAVVESSTILEITHGIVSHDVDAEYIGWHISYEKPNMAGGIYFQPNSKRRQFT